MATALQQSARQEAEWVQRYSQLYRDRMARLIETVNHSLAHGPGVAATAPARPSSAAKDAAGQSIRCCLEAVDLMLSSQAEFAQVIHRLATQEGRPSLPISPLCSLPPAASRLRRAA